MKVVTVLCLLGVAFAAPSPPICKDDAKILKYDNDNTGLGRYKFELEQTDGIKHEEHADVINEGRDDQYLSVKGSFTYIGNDGVNYTVTYVADDNGYQPEIEQGPGGGVPPAVVASLLG